MPRRARRCGGRRVMSRPSNTMRPWVGRTTPVTALNSVVLPAPLGPMIARRSPRGIDMLTPSTARSASKATTSSSKVSTASVTVDCRARRRAVGENDSASLHALEAARVGRLLQVDFRIVLPELRNVRIDLGGHVPVFAVGAPDHLADIDVVDRIAVGIEPYRLAERGIRQVGLEDGVDEGVAVLDLAADLLD